MPRARGVVRMPGGEGAEGLPIAEFQSTLWTLIRGARDGREEALTRFVNAYRPPVVDFCRRRGLESDAEDIAQEVMLRLLGDGVLLKADPSLGRFRSLVLAVTKRTIGHHLEKRSAAKRGGGKVVPLGDHDAAAPQADDGEFDRDWVAHLVRGALERLAESHPEYHRAVQGFHMEERSYAQLAADMGLSEGDVKNRLHRGRRKLIELVQEAIREYSGSAAEYDDEVRALSDLFLARLSARGRGGA